MTPDLQTVFIKMKFELDVKILICTISIASNDLKSVLEATASHHSIPNHRAALFVQVVNLIFSTKTGLVHYKYNIV